MPISKVTLPDNSTQDIKDSRLPDVTSGNAGRALVVNSDGEWDTGLPAGTHSYDERRVILSTSNPLYRYKICAYSRGGSLIPLTITDQTSETIVEKTPSTGGIDPQRGLVYYGGTTNYVNLSSSVANLYPQRSRIDTRYTFNTNIPTLREVYLKGTYDGHIFKLDTTSSTSWYVVATATNTTVANFLTAFTADCYYMLVGTTGSTENRLDLKLNNPLFYFDGSYLIQVNLDTGVQPTLVSGTNIKTINNESILGSGNIDVGGGSSLPEVTSSQNGQGLVVSGGAWAVGFPAGIYAFRERRYIHSTSTPLYRYKFCGYDGEGKLVPLTITDQTSTTLVQKTPTTVGIDPSRGLVYYGSTTDITSVSTAVGNLYPTVSNSACAYNFNASVPASRDVYLKGTYSASTGLFTLDTTSDTSWYVFAPNLSTDGTYNSVFTSGYYYMYVGPTYTTANYIHLEYKNPLYYYNGTRLIPVNLDSRTPSFYSGSSEPASSLGNDGDIYIKLSS